MPFKNPEVSKKWLAAHKEQRLRQGREYWARNKAQANERQRTRAASKRDEIKVKAAEYRRKNADAIRARDRARYANNPERRRQCIEGAAQRYRNNPRRARELRLPRSYGLSYEQYDALIVAQSGRCAICSKPFRGIKEPHVDHCHDKGTVRGLLCSPCNTGIGQFQERPEFMRNAITYLLKHGGT